MSLNLDDFNAIDSDTLQYITKDDETILKALAVENKKYITLQGKTRWFGLYTLQHRGGYSPLSTGSNFEKESYAIIKTPISGNSSNSFYTKINNELNTSSHSISESDLTIQKDHPKWLYDEHNQLIVSTNNNIEYPLGNGVVLINEIDGLGQCDHSINMRSGALINASFITTPIYYEGYVSVWNGKARQNSSYTAPNCGQGLFYEIGAPTFSDEEYTIFVRRGEPLSENNWIIAYVERGIANAITSYNSQPTKIEEYVKKYACTSENNNLQFNMQIYINLFMPNGKLVRTKLDRSALYFGATAPGPNSGPGGPGYTYGYNNWVYRDYANTAAKNDSLTFSLIWNSILSGDYEQWSSQRDKNFSIKDKSTHWLYYWDSGTKEDLNNNFQGINYEDIKTDAPNFATWQYNGSKWNGRQRG